MSPDDLALARRIEARSKEEFIGAQSNFHRPHQSASIGDIEDLAAHGANAAAEDDLRPQKRATTRGTSALDNSGGGRDFRLVTHGLWSTVNSNRHAICRTEERIVAIMF